MPDTRKRIIASLEVWPEMLADPITDDYGYRWYDILEKSWDAYGTSWGSDSNGVPLVQFLKDGSDPIGLMLRPYLILQNTRLSHFTAADTTHWEEATPSDGEYRVSRLVMYNNTGTATQTLNAANEHPENPHFAISLYLADVVEGWDPNTSGNAYFRFIFGNGRYALMVHKDGLFLQGYSDVIGDFVSLKHMGRPEKVNSSDETMIWVICVRGKIGVSTNMGRTYHWYGNKAAANYIRVARGKFKVQVRGGTCMFGIHQLRYYTSYFRSYDRDTFTIRPFSPISTIVGHYDAFYGSSVSLTDMSTPLSGNMAWKGTLTPAEIPAVPWKFYSSPVLFAVQSTYPVTQFVTSIGATARPFDKYLLSGEINKPWELDESTCTIEFHQNSFELFSGNWEDRKVRLNVGYKHIDDSEEWFVAFVGYVTDVSLRWSDTWGEVAVTMQIGNMTHRLKEVEWDETDVLPLGGLTPNQVGDYILYTESMTSAYRAWHALGDVVSTYSGPPDKPFELIRRKEKKWETLKRYFAYFDLSVGATDSGQYFSVPDNLLSMVVNKTVTAGEDVDIRNQVADVTVENKAKDRATCVITYGEDEYKNLIMGFAIDRAAETDIAATTGRARPWRVKAQEEQRDSIKSALLLARTQAIARQTFRVKIDPVLQTPIDLESARKDRIVLNGCGGVGIADGTHYGVRSLKHSFKAEGDLASSRTTYELEQVPPI